MSDEIPKLRMAPPESAEELAHRFDQEKRRELLQTESNLEDSLHPFRVGSVPHLNAIPLTRGLEEQILFAPPTELAKKLRADELDGALLSVTEVLFNDRYDILDGIAVASLGEVKSVFLAHRQPLEEVREIYCDPASLASFTLLKLLLAERNLKPEFKPLTNYADAPKCENVFLFGDTAIEFLLANQVGQTPTPAEGTASGGACTTMTGEGAGPTTHLASGHEVWDLGTAWFELTQLPFVFAVWALRRIPNQQLRRQLREAKAFGMDTLDYIISSRSEFTLDFRKDYLGWHIHYHLGSDEKRGMAKFVELLRKHGFGPVYEPRFVS